MDLIDDFGLLHWHLFEIHRFDLFCLLSGSS